MEKEIRAITLTVNYIILFLAFTSDRDLLCHTYHVFMSAVCVCVNMHMLLSKCSVHK